MWLSFFGPPCILSYLYYLYNDNDDDDELMLPLVIKQKHCLEHRNSCGWMFFNHDSTNDTGLGVSLVLRLNQRATCHLYHTVSVANPISSLITTVMHAHCELAGFECNTKDVISYFGN